MGKVLHASGSGYFLRCIEDSTDSKYAVWPLERAMQTYWRVRAWDFNANIVVRLFNFPEGENTDLPFTISVTNIRSYVEDEQMLVCTNEFDKDDNLDGFQKQANLYFLPEAFGDQSYRKVGDLYYSGFNGDINDGESGTEFSFSPDDKTYSLTSQFTVSILGATLAITAFNYVQEEQSEVISCTASLTPSEWWSYGGMYNTATGALL
jgi:hypothetical protein